MNGDGSSVLTLVKATRQAVVTRPTNLCTAAVLTSASSITVTASQVWQCLMVVVSTTPCLHVTPTVVSTTTHRQLGSYLRRKSYSRHLGRVLGQLTDLFCLFVSVNLLIQLDAVL